MNQDTLLTFLYSTVDDFLHIDWVHKQLIRPGAKPRFSDSELITLSLYQEFTDFKKEDAYFQYASSSLRSYFPLLVDKSQYNRRRKNLLSFTNEVRRHLVNQMPPSTLGIIDTLPVPVCMYTKGEKTKQFENAGFGRCQSKKLKYFGYKTGLVVNHEGLVLDYVVDSASPHDSQYGQDLLFQLHDIDVLGDKGFPSEKMEEELFRTRRVRLVTPKRSNSKKKNSEPAKWLLRKCRSVVETVNSQLVMHFSFEQTWGKSERGVFTRLVTKLTAHTIGIFINRTFGFPPLSLSHLMNLF